MNWPKISVVTNVAGIMLFASYALLVGFQQKPPASAQTAYVGGTTVGMDQTTCAGSTPSNPRNIVTNGTTFVCAAAGISYGARIVTDSTGLAVWTYPTNCQNGSNIPLLSAVAEGPSPQAGVSVNVQVEGAPSSTQASFRVTKSNATVVALLGLTILSIPATVGATTLDVSCTPQ